MQRTCQVLINLKCLKFSLNLWGMELEGEVLQILENRMWKRCNTLKEKAKRRKGAAAERFVHPLEAS